MAAKKQRKARVSTVPPDETKAAKFSRLASARMTKTLKAIAQVANLSGSGYEYTADQVTKIEAALHNAVTETMSRFAPKKAASQVETFTV